jgi:hypothetical protein
VSGYYRSSLADDLSRAWLETKKIVDPNKLVAITAQNGQVAQVIATSFLQSLELEAAGYNNKLPSQCELSRTDFVRLNLGNRSQVTVNNFKLQVMIVGNDPVDPFVQLSLEMFN